MSSLCATPLPALSALHRCVPSLPSLSLPSAPHPAPCPVQVTLRSVTTSALADLTLSSALLPAPGTVDSFAHDAVLLHAPSLSLGDAARYGLKGGSAGVHVVHAVVRGEHVLATLTPQEKQRIGAEDQQSIAARQVRAPAFNPLPPRRLSVSL